MFRFLLKLFCSVIKNIKYDLAKNLSIHKVPVQNNYFSHHIKNSAKAFPLKLIFIPYFWHCV